MSQSPVTSSPMNLLADLFLRRNGQSETGVVSGKRFQGVDEAFGDILAANMKMADQKTAPTTIQAQAAALRAEFETVQTPAPVSAKPAPRQKPLENLQDQMEELGVPLDDLELDGESLLHLKEVLEESGYSAEQIQQFFTKLSEGPLTGDRLMSLLSSLDTPVEDAGLVVTPNTKTYLSRFLQELGYGADEVKNVVNQLRPGQELTGQRFQAILTQLGGENLKGPIMGNVDLENLENLLLSLGVRQTDIQDFFDKVRLTGGRMSLEGLVKFLGALERPKAMTEEQTAVVDRLVRSLVLKEPLAPKLNFNHTLSLLQALSGAQNGGAGGADSSTSDNPAMQALRGQGSAVGRLAPSIGQSGQEATSGQRNFNGFLDQNFRSAHAAATKSSNALPPRVSYSMVHQIADKMAWQVKNNVNRVHVQLNPPELGRVEVQMVMRNNQVQAQVVTEHAAVRGALEEHYAVLRDNLASRGLQLEKFDVYSGPQRELSWSHSEQRQGGGNGRRKNGGSSDRPDPDGQPASRPNLRRHYGQIDHVI